MSKQFAAASRLGARSTASRAKLTGAS